MKPVGALTRFARAVSGRVLGTLYASRVLERILRGYPNRLTALSYHRIEDPFRAGFDSYRPNVSATPEAFRQQMQYLKDHYNVITCEQLALWLRGACELPPRPAIITFDDGYYDNLVYAYPILRELGLPATIFLCSGSIGSDVPFPWDYAAYCFFHTKKNHAQLPLTGTAAWQDETSRELLMREWFRRTKYIPDVERHEIVAALAHALDVNVPAGAFAGLYLSWDQVRELDRNGIEMGAHTTSHPILTGIPLERARREILDSKAQIEAELGKPVTSFAYPNGGRSDFSPAIMSILQTAGIEVAFTLLPGPTRLSSVLQNPLAIRRVFVGYADSFPRFLAKLAGFARFATL